MAAPVAPPRCQWHECPLPGPYATHKALHEHLKAAHNPAKNDDAVFVCKWAGCTHVSAGLQSRMQHLGRHTEYRPHICSHPDCAKAYTCSQDLAVHRRRHRAAAAGATSQGQCACEWAGCAGAGVVFPGAAELRAHLERAHRGDMKQGLRCGWKQCSHVLAGGNFKAHVWSHLPAWYRPFACLSCDRAFSTAGGLARHAGSAHPAAAPKRTAASDSDGSATEYTRTPASASPVKRQRSITAVASPATDSDSDAEDDYAPAPPAKHVRRQSLPDLTPSPVLAPLSELPPTPLSKQSRPPPWLAPAAPLASEPSPSVPQFPPRAQLTSPPRAQPMSPPRKVKLTLNSPPRPAKRPRLDSVSTPRKEADDDSESELDIVITVPLHAAPVPLPRLTTMHEPSEIASAVADVVNSPAWARGAAAAKIVDSPVWARSGAAAASAARMAASRSPGKTRMAVDVVACEEEDGDDWEYCT